MHAIKQINRRGHVIYVIARQFAKRAEKAVSINVGASFLKVRQAVHAAGFTDDKSKILTLQQRVCRIIKEKLEKDNTMQDLCFVQIRPYPLPVADVSPNTLSLS